MLLTYVVYYVAFLVLEMVLLYGGWFYSDCFVRDCVLVLDACLLLFWEMMVDLLLFGALGVGRCFRDHIALNFAECGLLDDLRFVAWMFRSLCKFDCKLLVHALCKLVVVWCNMVGVSVAYWCHVLFVVIYLVCVGWRLWDYNCCCPDGPVFVFTCRIVLGLWMEVFASFIL
eukprot:gene2689-1687_t